MPAIVDKKVINNKRYDKRVKLTDVQRKEIGKLKGTTSQKNVADLYGVDRRTVSFIWFPEKLAYNKQLRAERGGSKQYYDRDKHRISMRLHRNYKRELDEKGLI